MLVEKKRLIELLNHEDERVKSAALDALVKFFPGSDGIIPHILKSIANYKHDLDFADIALENMRYFIPTVDDVKEILRIYFESANDKNDSVKIFNWEVGNILDKFPFHTLEKNYNTISLDKDLLKIYNAVKKREQIRCREPEDLWQELTSLCNRYRNAKMVNGNYSYCYSLVEALSQKQKGEKVVDKVIKYLSQTTEVNYHFENFLVILAGNLKLVEVIPYIFRILIDSHYLDYVYTSCINSLGKIGTPGVVNEIGTLYKAHPDLKTAFAEILKYIPYDYSEKLAIQLLQKETKQAEITFLSKALCDIFSIKSGELILGIIKKKSYNPMITFLLDNLIPVYVYHNKTIDNLLKFEKEDISYRQESLIDDLWACFFNQCQYCIEQDEQDAQENCELDNDCEIKIVMPRNRIPSKKNKRKKDKFDHILHSRAGYSNSEMRFAKY